MINLDLDTIDKFIISSRCRESSPCGHASELILKDGSRATGLRSTEIWSIVSELAKEKLYYNTGDESGAGFGDNIFDHFRRYDKPHPPYIHAPKSAKEVMRSLCFSKALSNSTVKDEAKSSDLLTNLCAKRNENLRTAAVTQDFSPTNPEDKEESWDEYAYMFKSFPSSDSIQKNKDLSASKPVGIEKISDEFSYMFEDSPGLRKRNYTVSKLEEDKTIIENKEIINEHFIDDIPSRNGCCNKCVIS